MNPLTPKILLAEDEQTLRTILKNLLQKKGLEVDAVSRGDLAFHKLQQETYTLAILDINLPEKSGLEILKNLKTPSNPTYFIIMTAQDTMHHAIDAMKQGAFDYLSKPFELEEFEIIVEKALKARALDVEVEQLRKNITENKEPQAKIIGRSKSVQEIYKTIGKIASSNLPVLITGESGTGKELIVKAIYQHSNRSQKKFLAVNCAAIPKDLLESELFGYRKGAFTGAEEHHTGFFEMAHQGTLFLDEIGDLPLNLQAKLLRVLQEKEIQPLGSTESRAVDVRILAATNKNLEELVEKKQFREDLLFRLNVIPIKTPPLRDRREDIPLLVEHVIRQFSRDLQIPTKRVSAEALKQLQDYNWPGNVRELENVLKRALLLSAGETLTPEDFSLVWGNKTGSENDLKKFEKMGLEELIEAKLNIFFQKTKTVTMTNVYSTIIEMAERPLIRLVLKQTKGNQIKASQILGINRNTLRKKIRELKISLED